VLAHRQVDSSHKISSLSLEHSRERCKNLAVARKKLERAAKGQVARLAASEGHVSRLRGEVADLRARVAAQDREFEAHVGVSREALARPVQVGSGSEIRFVKQLVLVQILKLRAF
jgi:hypothetical protein